MSCLYGVLFFSMRTIFISFHWTMNFIALETQDVSHQHQIPYNSVVHNLNFVILFVCLPFSAGLDAIFLLNSPHPPLFHPLNLFLFNLLCNFLTQCGLLVTIHHDQSIERFLSELSVLRQMHNSNQTVNRSMAKLEVIRADRRIQQRIVCITILMQMCNNAMML